MAAAAPAADPPPVYRSAGQRLAAAWRRPAVRRGALLLVAALAVFELGRISAGHSTFAALSDRRALGERITELERDNELLQRQRAAAEIGRRVDREAQAEAQRMMGELQAELGRQEQELQFLRGVLAERYGAGSLRVQELAVRPGAGRLATIEITLVQAASRDAIANGSLQLWINGTRGGRLSRLSLRQVSPTARPSVPFTLRYFAKVEVPVELPADFVPAGIEIEYRSNRAPGSATASFPWPADTAALTPPAATP